MSEAGLWKLLRANIQADLQRLESGMTSRGIPDVNGCHDGKEFWVELKYTTTKKVALRPEQVAWLLRRSKVGGRTFVLVKTPKELYLYSGTMARELLDDGLTVPPLEKWNIKAVDWEQLLRILEGTWK
jgi:Holliday junction resolvase